MERGAPGRDGGTGGGGCDEGIGGGGWDGGGVELVVAAGTGGGRLGMAEKW